MPKKAGKAAVFGEHDEGTLRQLADVASRAEHAALMADGHVGFIQPVGGVTAYRDEVSVMGVGVDIACGVAGIRTDTTLAHLGSDGEEARKALSRIADEVASTVSFGI